MANVLIIQRACNNICICCSGCELGKRWKNTVRVFFRVKALLQTITNKTIISQIKKKAKKYQINEIVLFVNLNCCKFPSKSLKDSTVLKQAVNHLAVEIPGCSILGILHQDIKAGGYQSQYAATRFTAK